MEDDNLSVRTPTNSEINMFRVMANQDFVDLKRPIPKSNVLNNNGLPEIAEVADIFPDEATAVPDEKPESPREQTDEEIPEFPEARVPETRVPETRVPETREHEPRKEEPDSFYTRAKQMTDAEIIGEKEGLLLELQMLEKQGIYKPSRNFTMYDSIEELQFQVDRANSIFGAQQAVDVAKTGIKLGSTAIEVALQKFGVNLLSGFSNNLCKDMNKFNRPLTKLYRKYWRRSGGLTSPETELLLVVGGSMLMTVLQNTNAFGMGGGMGAMGAAMGAAKAPVPPQAPQAPPASQAKPSLIRPPVIPAASWQPAPVVVPQEAFQSTRNVVVDKPPNGSAVTPTPRKRKEEALVL